MSARISNGTRSEKVGSTAGIAPDESEPVAYHGLAGGHRIVYCGIAKDW
jgi:hypothetical protein